MNREMMEALFALAVLGLPLTVLAGMLACVAQSIVHRLGRNPRADIARPARRHAPTRATT